MTVPFSIFLNSSNWHITITIIKLKQQHKKTIEKHPQTHTEDYVHSLTVHSNICPQKWSVYKFVVSNGVT